MPNWCSNSGYIKGDKPVLDEIWNTIHQGSMESDGHDPSPAITALRPCPTDLVNTVAGFLSENSPGYAEWEAQQRANKEKYGYTDWYAWCIDNWGTKWTPDFEFERHDDTSIWFHGQSAWSPPEELMRYISEKFPVIVEMTYDEESLAYIGSSVYSKGLAYECSLEPEFSYDDFTDETGETDYEAYGDRISEVRDACEIEAWKRYEEGLAESPKTVLMGRDILPILSKMDTPQATIAGEVIVSFPELGGTD